MTRRAFLATLAAYNADAVRLPVRLIIDQSARWRPGLLNNFWSGIWPEAVREINPGTLSRQAREWRVDALATRMWLFQGSGEVRQAARRLTGPGALLR
jgi:hypothetical protein